MLATVGLYDDSVRGTFAASNTCLPVTGFLPPKASVAAIMARSLALTPIDQRQVQRPLNGLHRLPLLARSCHGPAGAVRRPKASSTIACSRAIDSGEGGAKSCISYTRPRNPYLLSPKRIYGSSS